MANHSPRRSALWIGLGFGLLWTGQNLLLGGVLREWLVQALASLLQ